MSFKICPGCKLEGEAKVCGQGKNQGRVFYSCNTCPNKKGDGKIFIGWLPDTPTVPESPQKKQKLSNDSDTTPTPPLKSQLESAKNLMESTLAKIYLESETRNSVLKEISKDLKTLNNTIEKALEKKEYDTE